MLWGCDEMMGLMALECMNEHRFVLFFGYLFLCYVDMKIQAFVSERSKELDSSSSSYLAAGVQIPPNATFFVLGACAKLFTARLML